MADYGMRRIRCRNRQGAIMSALRNADDERAYLEAAHRALNGAEVAERKLWQPNEGEQLAAAETLLKGPIPDDLRKALKRRFGQRLEVFHGH
jgi:ATP-dependent DNA ligase